MVAALQQDHQKLKRSLEDKIEKAEKHLEQQRSVKAPRGRPAERSGSLWDDDMASTTQEMPDSSDDESRVTAHIECIEEHTHVVRLHEVDRCLC